MNLQDAQVGDTVLRMIGGSIPMPLKVSRKDETFIYCDTPDGTDFWTFEIATGVEYDARFQWGSQWGKTGSVIIEVTKAKP